MSQPPLGTTTATNYVVEVRGTRGVHEAAEANPTPDNTFWMVDSLYFQHPDKAFDRVDELAERNPRLVTRVVVVTATTTREEVTR